MSIASLNSNSPSPMGSYSILRPPSLNFPSPVCRAMRQSKSKVLVTAAPPGFSSAGPPGFSSALLHGQDLVGGLGGDKDNVDQGELRNRSISYPPSRLADPFVMILCSIFDGSSSICTSSSLQSRAN